MILGSTRIFGVLAMLGAALGAAGCSSDSKPGNAGGGNASGGQFGGSGNTEPGTGGNNQPGTGGSAQAGATGTSGSTPITSGGAAGSVPGGSGGSAPQGGAPGTSAGGAGGRSNGGGGRPAAGGATGTAGTAGCTPNLACTPVAPNTGDPQADCVARVNQYRACMCLPALARDTQGEACANQQAQYDANLNMAHAGFSANICTPRFGAQNECPGYPSVQNTIDRCSQQMFDEGPGPTNPCTGACYEAHGHFINMTGNYSMVTCGFFTLPTGKVWTVQNFR